MRQKEEKQQDLLIRTLKSDYGVTCICVKRGAKPVIRRIVAYVEGSPYEESYERAEPVTVPETGTPVLFFDCVNLTASVGVVYGDSMLARMACVSLFPALIKGQVLPFDGSMANRLWSDITEYVAENHF